MAVFWGVALCSLVKFTGVSRMLTASIIRAFRFLLHFVVSRIIAPFLPPYHVLNPDKCDSDEGIGF
jgi:hypothetical protein